MFLLVLPSILATNPAPPNKSSAVKVSITLSDIVTYVEGRAAPDNRSFSVLFSKIYKQQNLMVEQ